MPTQRGTQKMMHIRMGPVVYDRIQVISAKKGLTINEVLLRLLIIGLDTSNDMALTEPVVEGMTRYPNVSAQLGRASRSGSNGPDSDREFPELADSKIKGG